ncbi:hypothetical protein HDU67_009553 [Dinochytrium kinnereticum]|nr:hypothetical protein HDU67_009553 [Dinochytrium kinnereticum]
MRAACPADSVDPNCSDETLLATLCFYDGGLEVVRGLGVCQGSVPVGCGDACGTPIPDLFSSQVAYQGILSICGLMTMEQCARCNLDGSFTATASQLPRCNVLEAYGSLCLVMPDMTDCQRHQTTCSNPTISSSSSLSPLCRGTSNSDPNSFDETLLPPVMRMYFHTGITDYVLFKSFVPRTMGQYLGACVFTALLAVLMMAVEATRRRMMRARGESVRRIRRVERRRRREGFVSVVVKKSDGDVGTGLVAGEGASTGGMCCGSTTVASPSQLDVDASSGDEPAPPPPSAAPHVQKVTLVAAMSAKLGAWGGAYGFRATDEWYHVVRAVLRTVEVAFAYLLMLVVMQFNVGLIVAALFGVFVGNYVFGREEGGVKRGGAEGDCCM